MQRIENEIKPGIFEEKRGIAALLFKNSRFYFVRAPKDGVLLCIGRVLLQFATKEKFSSTPDISSWVWAIAPLPKDSFLGFLPWKRG